MKCLCYSEKLYEQCCEPFHNHFKNPATPLQLMRSRYSAYALNLSQYIIETTHPKSVHYQSDIVTWKSELESFSQEHEFVGLQIESEEAGFPIAYVTFIAKIKRHNGPVEKQV
ncbi:MAG: YchJ family metal-binding protein [Rhabdochlamydiaceae bacterium]|nr:YchJ family metal-binding protein [Candidatus Amphrikana amoebophyrae]